MPGTGSSGYERHDGVEVVHSSGSLEHARLGELIGDGDHVGGFTVGIQRQDGFEDGLVLGVIKVSTSKNFDHVGHSIFAQ